VVLGDATHYGGVRSWERKGARLELIFDHEAQQDLGVEWISIALKVDKTEIKGLDAALKRVFAG
jgi:hypothetical protein